MSTYPPENDSPNATPIYDRSVPSDVDGLDDFDATLHGTDAVAGSATADGPAFRDGSTTETTAGVHVPRYATGGTTSGSAADTASAKADAAKGAAKDVAGDAKQAGQKVAGTAKEQATKVASEATDHAKQLYGEASSSIKDQAGQQQERAAGGLRSIGQQLASMADNSQDDGIATKVVRDLGNRAHTVAGFLEDRDPGSLLDEVKSFAARRPGTFIALAAGAGILAGRLTKALAAEAKHEHEDGSGTNGASL